MTDLIVTPGARRRARSASVSALSILTASLFTLVTVSAHPAAAQARKVTLEELTRESTSVIVGTTTGRRSFWTEDRSKILTEVTVRVDQRVKGNVAAEAVITIPGGQVGNIIYDVSDMPVFFDGEEVLVFLWEDPAGRQLVTGAVQGKLPVLEDPSTGAKVIPGSIPLLDENETLGAAVDARARTPLDEVLDAVRRAEDN